MINVVGSKYEMRSEIDRNGKGEDIMHDRCTRVTDWGLEGQRRHYLYCLCRKTLSKKLEGKLIDQQWTIQDLAETNRIHTNGGIRLARAEL